MITKLPQYGPYEDYCSTDRGFLTDLADGIQNDLDPTSAVRNRLREIAGRLSDGWPTNDESKRPES